MYNCIVDNANKAQNKRRFKARDTYAAAFPRKNELSKRISESVTPTSLLREIRRIRRLMRRGFRLPLLPCLAQLRPPDVLSRVRALLPSRYPSCLPVSWHPAYWFYKLVRESDESTLLPTSHPFGVRLFPSFMADLFETETISLSVR